MTKPILKGWGKELIKIFKFREGDIVRPYTDIHTDIEVFISNLLKKEREKVIEEIRKAIGKGNVWENSEKRITNVVYTLQKLKKD